MKKKLRTGYDIIFVARTAGEQIKTLKFADIEKDLNKVLKNVKIFK